MLFFVPPALTLARRAFSAPLYASRPAVSRPPTSFFGRALLSATLFAAPFAAVHADASSSPAMSLSDLPPMKDIDGNQLSPSLFDGKVVFVMNVASACGYTQAGYALFKKLTDKYSPDHFVAVAIPCNSFGFQESGSADQIKTFALQRANKLLIMQRSNVNGPDQHPIIELAKSKFPASISWNFDGRFVFDKSGQPVARFGNSATDQEIEQAIDKAL
ncbi:unnamed protein product [Agarophyton chilense]